MSVWLQDENTEHAATLLRENSRQPMDHGKLKGAVFIDLKKAFNDIDHSIILKKLPFHGISNSELSWVKATLKTDTSIFSEAL